jgi:hypothetical protein
MMAGRGECTVASVLDAVAVKSPCTVRWGSMRGDDRVRFCGHCRQHVFNLSGMTRAEAEAVVSRKTGGLCVRFYRRADGTVATRRCGGLAGRLAKAAAAVAAVWFALMLAFVGWALGRSDDGGRYDNWARRTEPFATLLEWIDPAPKVFLMGGCPGPPPGTPFAP